LSRRTGPRRAARTASIAVAARTASGRPGGKYSSVARSENTSARLIGQDRPSTSKAPRPCCRTTTVSSPGVVKRWLAPASRRRRQLVSSRAPCSPRRCSSCSPDARGTRKRGSLSIGKSYNRSFLRGREIGQATWEPPALPADGGARERRLVSATRCEGVRASGGRPLVRGGRNPEAHRAADVSRPHVRRDALRRESERRRRRDERLPRGDRRMSRGGRRTRRGAEGPVRHRTDRPEVEG